MAKSPFIARDPLLVSSNVFVVEHYLASADRRHAETLTQLLRATDGGLRHALFVPADETYFAVYDNSSAEAVRTPTAVADRSRSPLDRIVRAVLFDSVTAPE
jgi:hypothetical protein